MWVNKFQYIYNSNPWRRKQWNEVEVSYNRCPQQQQNRFQEMKKKNSKSYNSGKLSENKPYWKGMHTEKLDPECPLLKIYFNNIIEILRKKTKKVLWTLSQNDQATHE